MIEDSKVVSSSMSSTMLHFPAPSATSERRAKSRSPFDSVNRTLSDPESSTLFIGTALSRGFANSSPMLTIFALRPWNAFGL
jgi:hypothetical protein